jgi:hypothetical protein
MMKFTTGTVLKNRARRPSNTYDPVYYESRPSARNLLNTFGKLVTITSTRGVNCNGALASRRGSQYLPVVAYKYEDVP